MSAEENYRKAIQEAEEEVARLTVIRASIDRKLAQLKAAITALSSLLEEPPKAEDPTTIVDAGISNAIRQVLREAAVGLTPAQIKARLSEAKFDLSKYANPSAVIHNTIKRLHGQEEVVPVRDSSGDIAYALSSTTAFGEGIAKAIEAASLANQRITLPPIPSLAAFEQNVAAIKAASAKHIENIEQALKKTGGFK